MSQVSDYNIANASGASVRSDINAVLDAIKTFNSGGSDPSNTAAFMPYVDTADSNNLKIRNAANNGFIIVGSVNSPNLGLLPVAGGTMTGQLLADNSAGAGAPAIAFNGDASTGIFRVGSNTIGFATAGVERVEISDAGLDMSNGLPIRFQDSSGAPFVALKSPASVSSNVTFTLPAADGTNGQMLQTNGSGALSFTTVQGVPTGSVFCMAVAVIPSGYLECDGDEVPRTGTYAALFAVIGTTYGTGNGSSTFNLPDLRGEFVRGFDNGRGVDSGRGINDPQGSLFGSHDHDADANASSSVNDPGHRHTLRGGNDDANSGSKLPTGDVENKNLTADSMNNATTGISVNTSVTIDIDNEGGSETRPRNIAMMYIIKF